jgi:hypothetical protein
MHYFYSPDPKNLNDYLELLCYLDLKDLKKLNPPEKKQILTLIAAGTSKYDLHDAIYFIFSSFGKNDDEKRDHICELFNEIMKSFFLRKESNFDDVIIYFQEELFSYFVNDLQCDLYEIEEEFENRIKSENYFNLTSMQRLHAALG